jgi:hypothetical protein
MQKILRCSGGSGRTGYSRWKSSQRLTTDDIFGSKDGARSRMAEVRGKLTDGLRLITAPNSAIEARSLT